LHLQGLALRFFLHAIWIPLVALLPGLSTAALAQSDVAALQQRLDAALPGSVIELSAGSYKLGQAMVLSRSGTESSPIVIKARERGRAVFDGKAGLELRGASHVVIEGIAFVHENRTPAIRLVDCTYVRITRCSFKLDSSQASRQNWIHITGSKSGQNRIDHNLFDDLASAGAYIAIDGSETAPLQISKGDRIDYNHFRSIARRDGGGARAIRLGWTKLAPSQGQTVVEYNLFETCNGDDELITVRSSGQFIRFNTFLNSAGYLTLRAGSGNVVEGNFFYSENKEGVGGVRIFGDSAKVFNNYFEGLTAPALVLSNGLAEPSPIEAPRAPATKAAIVFNTWVNCGGGAIELGATGGGIFTKPPADCIIANNVAIGYGDELVRVRSKSDGVRWSKNIMFHAGAKEKVGIDVPDDQISVVFPRLRNQGGIWRLSPNSPAIDFAEGEFDFVTTDIDGQPRPKKMDVGSDEFATGPIKQRPFAAIDVGVEAP